MGNCLSKFHVASSIPAQARGEVATPTVETPTVVAARRSSPASSATNEALTRPPSPRRSAPPPPPVSQAGLVNAGELPPHNLQNFSIPLEDVLNADFVKHLQSGGSQVGKFDVNGGEARVWRSRWNPRVVEVNSTVAGPLTLGLSEDLGTVQRFERSIGVTATLADLRRMTDAGVLSSRLLPKLMQGATTEAASVAVKSAPTSPGHRQVSAPLHSLNKLSLPIEEVFNTDFLEKLKSPNSEYDQIILDGGNAMAYLDSDAIDSAVVATLKSQELPFFIHIDHSSRTVQGINGLIGQPTKADLQRLTDVGILSASVLPRLMPLAASTSVTATSATTSAPTSPGHRQVGDPLHSLTRLSLPIEKAFNTDFLEKLKSPHSDNNPIILGGGNATAYLGSGEPKNVFVTLNSQELPFLIHLDHSGRTVKGIDNLFREEPTKADLQRLTDVGVLSANVLPQLMPLAAAPSVTATSATTSAPPTQPGRAKVPWQAPPVTSQPETRHLLVFAGPGQGAFDQTLNETMARNISKTGRTCEVFEHGGDNALRNMYAALARDSSARPSLLVNCHGEVNFGQHQIYLNEKLTATRDFFNEVHASTRRPVDLFLTSCHGGAALEDAHSLPAGSSVVVIAPATQTASAHYIKEMAKNIGSAKSLDAKQLLLTYCSTLDSRVEPAFWSNGKTHSLDTMLGARMGQRFTAEEKQHAHNSLRHLMPAQRIDDVIAKIEQPARNTYGVYAADYGPALAVVASLDLPETTASVRARL